MVLRDFTKEDFIVVKMDIDHSPTELPLAQRLLNDTKLHKLVDHFYFEQHVIMKEMLGLWGGNVRGKCIRIHGVVSEFEEGWRGRSFLGVRGKK